MKKNITQLLSIILILSSCNSKDEIKVYYDDTNELKEIHTIENGEQNGEQKYFYKAGNVNIIVNSANGEFNGRYISFHENGNIKSKGEYNKGELDGYWEYFFEDGRKKMAGNYSQGEMLGEWEYTNPNEKVYWTTYKSQADKFSISIPKTWNINDTTDNILMTATSKLENEKDSFQENLNLIVDSNTSSNAWILNDYVKEYYKNLVKEFEGYEISILNTVDVIPNNRLYCTYNAINKKEKYKILNYFFTENNRIFVLSFYSTNESFDNYLFLYEEIINSFKVYND